MIEWARPDWWDEAKCRASGPLRFYPEKGEGGDSVAWAEDALAVCNGRDGGEPCPVKRDCLEYALEHHEKFGIWGGRTEQERRAIRRMRRRQASMTRVVRTVKKSPLRQLLATAKTETRILGAIQRHLMVRVDEKQVEYQTQPVIHPSEMCKTDWCPRATFFRLVGAPAAEAEPNAFTLENVFQEGHDIHHKWQNWLWEMGILRGRFRCNSCGGVKVEVSPQSCSACGAGRWAMEYLEAEFRSEKYLIAGHADGDIADDDNEELCPLLEVKSIGTGTLRFEAPSLLAKHTHKAKDDDGTEKTLVDYEGLWRDIKRPFPSHLRQGTIYLAVSGRQRMVFIYEAKWSQQVKEFRVKYQPEIVAELLDACLDIKYALKTNNPPCRPSWAASDNSTCSKCVYRDTCWDTYLESEHAGEVESLNGNGRGVGRGEGSVAKRRIRIAGASGLRNSETADQTQ